MGMLDKISNFVNLVANDPEKAKEKLETKAETTLEDVTAFAKQVKNRAQNACDMVGLRVEKGLAAAAQYTSDKVGAVKYDPQDGAGQNALTILGNSAAAVVSLTPLGLTSCTPELPSEIPPVTTPDEPQKIEPIDITRYDEFGIKVLEKYNDKGQLVEKHDYQARGKTDPFLKTYYEYDADGKLKTERTDFLVTDKYNLSSNSTYEYDVNGKVAKKTSEIKEELYRNNVDGAISCWPGYNTGHSYCNPPKIVETYYKYDVNDKGQVTKQTENVEGKTVASTEYVYDDNGKVAEKRQRTEYGHLVVTDFTYSNGKLASKNEYNIAETIVVDKTTGDTIEINVTDQLPLMEEEYNNGNIVYRKNYKNRLCTEYKTEGNNDIIRRYYRKDSEEMVLDKRND